MDRHLPYVAAVLAVVLMPALVFAQQASEGRVEVGGDVRWLAGMQFHDVNANETAFGGATRTVFKTSTSFGQAFHPEARVAVGLTSILDADAGIAFGRTDLTTTITDDPEASNTTVSEPVTEYLLEAGLAAHLARWQRGRATPFASAGIGYLRQLHDEHTLVQGGRTWYLGGGLHFAMKDAARGWKSAGLRLELRATILTGSSTLDGGTHVLPAVIAGLFFHL